MTAITIDTIHKHYKVSGFSIKTSDKIPIMALKQNDFNLFGQCLDPNLRKYKEGNVWMRKTGI